MHWYTYEWHKREVVLGAVHPGFLGLDTLWDVSAGVSAQSGMRLWGAEERHGSIVLGEAT